MVASGPNGNPALGNVQSDLWTIGTCRRQNSCQPSSPGQFYRRIWRNYYVCRQHLPSIRTLEKRRVFSEAQRHRQFRRLVQITADLSGITANYVQPGTTVPVFTGALTGSNAIAVPSNTSAQAMPATFSSQPAASSQISGASLNAFAPAAFNSSLNAAGGLTSGGAILLSTIQLRCK